MARGQKNGLLRNSAGETVLWVNGTEVMAFDTDKASFFAAAPATQQAHIADSTDTSLSDQKAPVNSALAVHETFGVTATS
jgi:hypothetical protein